jgi:hypothetical protein
VIELVAWDTFTTNWDHQAYTVADMGTKEVRSWSLYTAQDIEAP